MNKPLINILTRTSGRPNYFKLCKESVLNQTYDNINHIVCTDDKDSMDYVGEECVFVKRCGGQIRPTVSGRRPALHNLYLNRLHEEVKEGWIMYLDDDDKLHSENSVQEMVNNIKNDSEIILWKVKIGDRIVPYTIPDRPSFGNFDGCGFLYNHKFKSTKWGYYTGGDIDFILTLWPKAKNKKWIDKILTSSLSPGMGYRNDLSL